MLSGASIACGNLEHTENIQGLGMTSERPQKAARRAAFPTTVRTNRALRSCGELLKLTDIQASPLVQFVLNGHSQHIFITRHVAEPKY
jgi:hypothetical protein